MKKIMLVLLALTAVPAAAAERRYTVTDYDRVQIDGPFQVVMTTGKSASAIASGSPQALDRVSVEVQGRTLKVKPNRAAWGGYPGEGSGPVKIMLTAHELRSVTVTGSGTLTIDKIRAMKFDLALSGSGRVAVGRLEADVAGLNLIGGGQIHAAGAVKSLRSTMQGSGDLKAELLTVQDAQLFSETSGTIDLAVKGTVKVRSTGSGDILISGKPACTVEALGSGRVVCGS